jgi:redox-sensitive bicupin YhaK (pirin superfamily)
MEVLEPRDVPLGGLRALTVRRTLPQRQRSLIGPWCFVDHYGPDALDDDLGMALPPHPHTGLATVSWLFSGAVEHRDSAGHHAFVRPGEINLMTAGRGISHSEYSTPDTHELHGCQLWLALPDASRNVEPRFEHHRPDVLRGRTGWEVRVFLGSLLGSTSPVHVHSPLVGAEIVLRAGNVLTVPVDPTFEHGVLVDTGDVRVDGKQLEAHRLGYVDPGADTLVLSAEVDSRLVLLGGAPLGEQIVMWWNFIGRSHEEVVAYREQWERLLAEGSDDRFSLPEDDPLPALHAPVLPNVRLRARG